jgi:hypothetical protein
VQAAEPAVDKDMSMMAETRTIDLRPVAGHIACGRHPFEVAAATCKRCRSAHCSECLVFPFGPQRPPLCISCALVAGGIRRR